jgi:hypothetical protein
MYINAMKFDTSLLRLLSVFSICALSTITPADADSDDDTPLAKTMEQSSDALKSLRKIDKDDWAGGAEAARSAADGLRKGMEFVPILIKGMPEGIDKAKALADYRRMMGLSYANLCELEIAYLEEDAEKVDAAMTKVKAGKKEGHKKYSDD